jgi:hypothetical protein
VVRPFFPTGLGRRPGVICNSPCKNQNILVGAEGVCNITASVNILYCTMLKVFFLIDAYSDSKHIIKK